MNTPELYVVETERFKSVLSARKTTETLLELFVKLEASDKFAEPAKPYCFAMLLSAVVAKLKASMLPQLYAVMQSTDAAVVMRSRLTQTEYETIFCKVVKVALESVPCDRGLVAVLHGLERSGISRSMGETISLAVFSGMPMPVLDDICDVLHEHYYSARMVQELHAQREAKLFANRPELELI